MTTKTDPLCTIDSSTLSLVLGGAPWAQGGAAANLKGNDARSLMVGPGSRAAIAAFGGWIEGAGGAAVTSRGNPAAMVGTGSAKAFIAGMNSYGSDPGGRRPLGQ